MEEPKDKRTKQVYLHILNKNNKVFYVGCGGKYRPTKKSQRTNEWNYFAKQGYYVRILQNLMTEKDALELESLVIETIGIENLSNKGNHLTWCKPAWNKGKKYGELTRKKISQNNKMKRKVLDSDSGVIYQSLTEMCKELGVSYSTIHKKLNGHLQKQERFKYI